MKRRKDVQNLFFLLWIILALSGGNTSEKRPAKSPAERLVWGCPAKDCIPAMDDPIFTTPQKVNEKVKFLLPEDIVIGVSMSGEAKAYPHKILTRHEIVNDKIGDVPIVVTYCPLCGSGMVLDSRIDGKRLTFGVSGRLLNSDLVMYDRETETLWSQITGEAILGKLVGKKLSILPTYQGTWKKWVELHPRTLVLIFKEARIPNFLLQNPYEDYDKTPSIHFPVTHYDDRYFPKEKVLGIHPSTSGKAKAYPFSELNQVIVVNDELQDKKLAIFYSREGQVALAYSSVVENKVLHFQPAGADRFRDEETGTLWNLKGEAIQGEWKGKQLSPISAVSGYWFAWVAFYPGTEVFQAAREKKK